MRVLAFILAVAAVLASPAAPARLLADDSQQILTVDHYLRVKSSVPAIAGQQAQLYVRERVAAGMALRARSFTDRVVLFVHGAGTPAEVSFDVPAEDYSWMAYLARAGFDVFSVDMTGYGRSTRPAAMSDPCNLAADRQPAFVPSLIPAPKIIYRMSENSRRLLQFHLARAQESLQAAGAYRTVVAPLIRETGWHLLGTARMGTDRRTSVVDGWGRCHDVPNLFIFDGSIWPTSSGMNPTATIAALFSKSQAIGSCAFSHQMRSALMRSRTVKARSTPAGVASSL